MFFKDTPTFLQSEVDLCYVGDIEISGDAFLEDLKMQVRYYILLSEDKSTH